MSECRVAQVWPIYRCMGIAVGVVGASAAVWELVEEHQGDLDSAYARCIELNDRTDRQHCVTPPEGV